MTHASTTKSQLAVQEQGATDNKSLDLDMPSPTLDLPPIQAQRGGTSENSLDDSALDPLRAFILLLYEWERKGQCVRVDAKNEGLNVNQVPPLGERGGGG